MNYEETLEMLYGRLQAFHKVGATAYKPGLDTTLRLAAMFGNPHRNFRAIHIAGTNGKGSTSHLLASILQQAGYKVGLYTSPHLLDFNERIRVNGEPISHELVVEKVRKWENHPERKSCEPSFFELATIMAFDHFSKEGVDVAVVETGLGGRLDSTNILEPELLDLTLITNISNDHQALLGDTLEAIAGEKAGIAKVKVPLLVSEYNEQTDKVFIGRAAEIGTTISFAGDELQLVSCDAEQNTYRHPHYGEFSCPLSGELQLANARAVMSAVDILRNRGYEISDDAVSKGFSEVVTATGLMGRWMSVGENPRVICDTGHNPGAWQYLGPRLDAMAGEIHLVLGFVSDKDLAHILPFMPRRAHYYFVQPDTPRALPAADLAARFAENGLEGNLFHTVCEGYETAHRIAGEGDTVFVGGSTFVVADFLSRL